MMTDLKKYIVSVCILVCNMLLFAQTPMLVTLDHNPVLRDQKTMSAKNNTMTDALDLPFFDDFSYYWHSSQPDQRLWMDNHVYINNHYPVQPRSNGVATFDALDYQGNIYGNTASRFPADTLTSRPVNLGGGLNNVYLSFFYQPQGHGDSPEPEDSLILQFKSPLTERWRTVWNTPGTSTHPFKQVLIAVEDEYLGNGFQFRFMNLASLENNRFNPGRRGNADHWHIDYVYMNSNRSDADTATHDIAMIEPLVSLIKGYVSIPWNQLQYAVSTLLEPRIKMTYRNNNNIDNFVYRNFTITDLYNNVSANISTGGAENIEADEIITFQQDIINPFESTSVDSALFELRGYLITDQFDRKANDTVRYLQFFKDYFARDDGSPESGYGFSGYNSQGCAVANRYETFMPDSLQAIMIYFNSTENNVTSQYRFKIAVWRDDNGRPGEMIYLSSSEYRIETTGKFIRFDLEDPVYVTRYFWIGWIQVTSGFLNVGFDKNNNDRGNLWFNTGLWYEDANNGVLMVRPVVGQRQRLVTSAEEPAMPASAEMKIYPNPASQYVRIETETIISSDYHVEIYDVAGRLSHSAQYTDEYIDVSGLEPGLHIVRLINRKSGNVQTQKMMIYR